MGFILDREHGMFSSEARRESFVIHFDSFNPEPRNEFLKDEHHPEFRWEDLDDLIATLSDLKEHARTLGIATAHQAPPPAATGEGA